MKRMKLIRVSSRRRKNSDNNDRMDPNSWNNKANLQRRENFQTEEVDVVHIKRRKAIIKILVWLALALFLLVGVFLIVLHLIPKGQTSNDKPLLAPSTPKPPVKRPYPQFLKRSDWGARPPKWVVNNTAPVHMVIIDYLKSRTCDSFPSCVKVVATQQSQDARDGYPDIFCNFLIGSDGNIYEGRGWGVQPEHRNDTIDIVYIGNYDIDKLTPTMIDAAGILLRDGLTRKYLAKDYIIVCNNQTRPNTLSPPSIFKEVKTWPRYDSGIYFEKQSKNKATEKL